MPWRQTLPGLWLLSDVRNDAALEPALRHLPRGSAFVFRHYHLDREARRARFDRLGAIAREQGHALILSGTEEQADAWGADGIYGAPEAIGRRGDLLRIATVHDAEEIDLANDLAASAAMLSPVFPTHSHPGGRALGAERFHALAALARIPVIALGGMTGARARELGWTRWAAIDGLALPMDS